MIINYIKAARLRTIPLSISGITISGFLALSKDQFQWILFLLALLTTTGFQVLSNFANDYGVLHTNGKFQGLLARSVVVTDSNHRIIHTQLVDQTGHEPDYDKVVEVLT